MSTGRVIAIGDIHGCVGKLEKMIRHLRPLPEDKLVFLGDYIDRGPDSAGVISFLVALSERIPCIFLRGNHEDMFLRLLRREPGAAEVFLINGGAKTVESYKHCRPPEDHMALLENTKLYHREGDVVFVHAGLNPDVENLEDQDEEAFLWIRDGYLVEEALYPWDFMVVSGHTPHKEPTIYLGGSWVVIDTGAVFERQGYGRLTAYDVTNGRFHVLGVDGVVHEH